MRDRIKEVATEMLIRHGYLGLRFQQIADALDITRGNIHYHFGNKSSIADEVIADYVQETLDIFHEIWTDPGRTLGQKIEGTMQANRRRYLRFNPDGKTVNAWSLIARMRHERDILSVKSRKVLDDFVAQLQDMMAKGVQQAVHNGELRPDTPVKPIAYQIMTMCNSSDPITRDAGSFERLALLYASFYDIVERAFGTTPKEEAPSPAPRKVRAGRGSRSSSRELA